MPLYTLIHVVSFSLKKTGGPDEVPVPVSDSIDTQNENNDINLGPVLPYHWPAR